MCVININDENRYNKKAIFQEEIYQTKKSFTLKDYNQKHVKCFFN